jgi:hypothetical protein
MTRETIVLLLIVMVPTAALVGLGQQLAALTYAAGTIAAIEISMRRSP